MLSELEMAELRGSDGGPVRSFDDLPELRRRNLGDAADVGAWVSAQRAALARLTLELRTLDADDDREEPETADVDAAVAFARASFAAAASRRRDELDEVVRQTRTDAADIIERAQRVAHEMVQTARAELLVALLGPRSAADLGPVPPSIEPTTVAIAGAPSGPVTASSVVSSADDISAGVETPSVGRTPATPAPAPALLQTSLVPEPAQSVRTRGLPMRLAASLSLDVVLPLIAVVIVIVILLAWVG